MRSGSLITSCSMSSCGRGPAAAQNPSCAVRYNRLQSAFCASRKGLRGPPRALLNRIWTYAEVSGMLPQLNPLQCALAEFPLATPLEYALAELLNLKSFRLRTYKKTGGRGSFPLHSRRARRVIPRSDFFPAREARRPESQGHTRRGPACP